MTKTRVLSILTASVMSISCFGVTAFADTAYEIGDVDMDGVITGHDTAMVSRYLLEEAYTLTEEQLALADVDGDGQVTQADADKLFNEMQVTMLGSAYIADIELGDYDSIYQDLNDAGEILAYYSARNVGLVYELSEVQKNLSDVNLDGEIGLDDAVLVLELWALRGVGLIGADSIAVEGVYYYSREPESPAFLGTVYN